MTAHPLEQLLAQVREFHVLIEHPAPDQPTLLTKQQVTVRGDWIEEEVLELRDALNLTEQVDAYLDILYFALGGLVETGVIAGPLFDMVQAANMAKRWPDGNCRRREDGKIIKPPEWVAPDAQIRAEIERQERRAEQRANEAADEAQYASTVSA